ncbi:MAG: T9SS type A sorting domain-containing protein [Flavobacteriales bacterium]|nr:T9SS type A sorting domain-containing protein [Flavobacteriales bacterium]
MNRLFTFCLASLVAVTTAFGQSTVTVNVTDGATAIEGASVTLNATMDVTNANGDVDFAGLVDGSYPYTVTANCFAEGSGTVVVSGGNVTENVTLTALTSATVFWNVAETSSPNSFPVAAASISMTDGTDTYTLAYGGFDNFMFDVPFGTYDYTISTDCHSDVTGTFTVDCANIDPNNPDPTVAVWEVQGAELTTAIVFWNVAETSSPNSFPVASASISMTDGTGTYTLAYGGFDNFMFDVPFGTYDYTISTDCHSDVTGTFTVDCANIDPNNPDPTVAVWEVQGEELTTAIVFWNVAETSSPNSFPVASASISMTDGTDTYTLAYGGFDNFMFDVPFGTYDYTISTDCHSDVTGTFTVDCANIDPNNPDPTVAVWEVQGDELTTATVFWNVAETSSPNSFPVSAASISMTDGTDTYTLAYSGFDNFMFEVPFGTYDYTISTDCHSDVTGTFTVDCANIDPNNPDPTVAVWEVQGDELTMATVFWNVAETSSPNSFPVSAASISMTDGTDTYTLAYSGFDNFMFDVPFGTYDYTISTDCHSDVTGTFTVDCANIDPNNPDPTVAVWEVQGDELTTATVFWNVAETSSPNSFPVSAASISMTDGTDTYTLAYSGFDNFMFEVPFGTYDYTISTDCHSDVTGTFTVDCANIDPNNPDPTVAVWEVQGDELTMATVFWNVAETASPNSFPVSAASISMTDGTDTYTLAYGGFDNFMFEVPFGTYDYTISTDCHSDVTGTFTVDCANIDPNNPDPTVAVWEVQGDEIVIDATVSQVDNVLTASVSGLTYQWVDCDNSNEPISGETGQSYTAAVNGNYAVIITDGNCSATSDCIGVSVGINELLSAEVSLFPNPVQEVMNIGLSETLENAQIEVVTLTGKVVYSNNHSGDQIRINLAKLSAGLYILNIRSDKGYFTKPIIKQ